MRSINNNAKKEILILGVTDASKDPRIHRQVEALRQKRSLVVWANEPPADRTIEFIKRSEPRLIRGRNKMATLRLTLRGIGFFLSLVFLVRELAIRSIVFWRLADYLDRKIVRRNSIRSLHKVKSKMILANDLPALPMAIWASDARPVVFDAHEYYPGQFLRSSKTLSRRKYDENILKRYLPRCSQMTTVSGGIQSKYRRLYKGPISLVMNAPDYLESPPSTPSVTVKFVHHGVAVRGRNIEEIIGAFASLPPGSSLDLYLVGGEGGYLEAIRELTRRVEGVSILPPVPMKAISKTLNNYDVGVYALPPTTENQRWALPNKFFEFIQARLAIIVGPSPEMAAMVRRYDLGVVADGFDANSIAVAMRSLTRERILYYKNQAHAVSKLLASEPQKEIIRQVTDEILANMS